MAVRGLKGQRKLKAHLSRHPLRLRKSILIPPRPLPSPRTPPELLTSRSLPRPLHCTHNRGQFQGAPRHRSDDARRKRSDTACGRGGLAECETGVFGGVGLEGVVVGF